MSEPGKITDAHRSRAAVVYVRQSTLSQLEHNTESTMRQYGLVERAVALGWDRDLVRVIDADLGVSGSVTGHRTGFESLVADVALGQVGIIVALEASRLARDNTAWYRLLDLAGTFDTLVADTDGVYHPGLFNDRLVLGMKGIRSEAELHVLRARLDGGIRNKAARGELRRGLPVGLVWGEADGEARRHPDEAVTGVIAAVFEQFKVLGSARAVWLWLKDQGLTWPLQQVGYRRDRLPEVTWVEPTYHAVHTTLTHPAYAGAYVYGRSKTERYLAEDGALKTRRRWVGQDQWQVCLTGHHEGFIDWDTYQANQARLASNIRPQAHQAGTGAVREGCALLQGLATCGVCGRKLAVYYDGKTKTVPGYHCGCGDVVNGRGVRHLRLGGEAVDAAVVEAFLAAVQPAAMSACLAAAERLEAEADTVLDQHRRQVEQARYAATKAERRYRAVDPENRLVARGLETEWNTALADVADAEAELVRREQRRPTSFADAQREAILALGEDLEQVFHAASTTDKDRKQLLRTLLEEVTITVHRDHSEGHAELLLRWKGGALTDLDVPLRRKPPKIRTSEDTVALLRRLAAHYPDAQIAGILNRQHRRTARGLSFTASRVQSLRHSWRIPCHQPTDDPHEKEGELLTVTAAAHQLGIAPSTLLRWLDDGFVTGEQLTPAAPWRIRLTDELRGLLVDEAPPGWLPLNRASLELGVSRQTVLQKVKRGDLEAVITRTGRRKGLRINTADPQESLF
ncbi:MAG TPA: recombinase family protein [Pseudonocardiaceae bacterium]